MPDKIDSENYFSVGKNFLSQIFSSPQSMLENEDILDNKCYSARLNPNMPTTLNWESY